MHHNKNEEKEGN